MGKNVSRIGCLDVPSPQKTMFPHTISTPHFLIGMIDLLLFRHGLPLTLSKHTIQGLG